MPTSDADRAVLDRLDAVQRYCDEQAADTLIHTWDLARAVGADERLPADLVDVAAAVVEPWITPGGDPRSPRGPG